MAKDRLKENKVRVTIVLEKEMRERIDEEAKEDNRTRSNYIESVLKKHFSSKRNKQRKQ